MDPFDQSDITASATVERQMSFKLDQVLADRLGRFANKLDVNRSKVTRVCLLLAMPIIEKNPLLVDVIDNINPQRLSQSFNGDKDA